MQTEGRTLSAPPSPTCRADVWARLTAPKAWDVVVVGGGATGLGVALQAAREGLSVALLEAQDFAQGTSSRSTKLVHGGVRYLAQGQVSLVREALRERRTLLDHAPHLAQPLAFVMPCYGWGERFFYGAGLHVYDWLSGAASLGSTRGMGREATLAAIPGVRPLGLRGGVEYWDGQFDDARLAITLARTAADHGACLLNHVRVSRLLYAQDRVVGVQAQDQESGLSLTLNTRCVVNATGVWVDGLRQLDARQTGQELPDLVVPSQGVHLVVDSAFWPGDKALLVPKTQDGRVLFAVPWLGKVLLGTTDTARHDAPLEPRPTMAEVDWLLQEAARYLVKAPNRQDVRSAWAGLRPLVVPHTPAQQGGTAKVSREHHVEQSSAGLLSVTGGKWTTYRAMAEDVLALARQTGALSTPAAATNLPRRAWVGAPLPGAENTRITQAPGEHGYGADQYWLKQLPGHDTELSPGLTEAMVRFATRYEYARCVDDVLARRSRCLFLDARLAKTLAPRVAQILEEELGVDPKLSAFLALAEAYSL